MVEVLAIGNAISDLIYKVSDKIISDLKLIKGSMTLCEKNKVSEIIDLLNKNNCEFICSSGGSAANTAYILNMQGVKTAFLGNVADDYYGKKYAAELNEVGIEFINSNISLGLETAKSLILISPDGERTMCTYLGCASNIKINSNLLDKFNNLKFLYIEGYLWDNDLAVNEITALIKDARKRNIKIAFSLSDSFCVDRNLDKFKRLFMEDIDIIFANESEINSFFNIKSLHDITIESIQSKIKESSLEFIIVTKNKEGSSVVTAKDNIIVATKKLEAIDSTGAGDAYAAGFLAKLLNSRDLFTVANYANFIAGQVVMSLGARPHNIIIDNDEELLDEINN
jgi:sugar/nucleoside kinase (ribokinase family)